MNRIHASPKGNGHCVRTYFDIFDQWSGLHFLVLRGGGMVVMGRETAVQIGNCYPINHFF